MQFTTKTPPKKIIAKIKPLKTNIIESLRNEVKEDTTENANLNLKLQNTEANTMIEAASTDEDISVDDANAMSLSEIETYITPVYGVHMRMSLDNKYIYDLDFNLVGTVIDSKTIEWVE